MNKILSGLLGLVLVAGLVGGSAYALLSDTASVTGVALSMGTAGLKIRAEGAPTDPWLDNLPLNNTVFANRLIPGRSEWGRFEVMNDSTDSDTDPIDMNLTAQLVSYNGNWGVLSDVVECAVYDEANAGTPTDGATTGWKKLSEWNSAPVALPSAPLVSGDSVMYTIRCRLPETAENEVAGKGLTDMQFDIVGTQVTPTVDF